MDEKIFVYKKLQYKNKLCKRVLTNLNNKSDKGSNNPLQINKPCKNIPIFKQNHFTLKIPANNCNVARCVRLRNIIEKRVAFVYTLVSILL